MHRTFSSSTALLKAPYGVRTLLRFSGSSGRRRPTRQRYPTGQYLSRSTTCKCVAIAQIGVDEPESFEDNMEPSLVVFSGGTAFNSIAGSLRALTTKVAHVLPVSDDGGSTAEIVRVLGGPAVGDIRSRCLRLADDSNDEANAVKNLLAHRLSSKSNRAARAEWYEIVEGQHELWDGVSEPYKHTIRAFLVEFHTQVIRHSTERFDFSNGSVGNFFFAGARVYLRSLEAAVFMFSRVARLPTGSQVLPAIRTEERITLGAQLQDGTLIRGQNAISHPPGRTSSSVRSPTLQVDKVSLVPMASPVQRVFYLSTDEGQLQHEVWPEANQSVLDAIHSAEAIVFGIGSLYTSICPSLVLQGVGESVAARSPLQNPPGAYVTAIIAPRGGAVELDSQQLADLGIRDIIEVASHQDDAGRTVYEPEALVQAIANTLEESCQGLSPEGRDMLLKAWRWHELQLRINTAAPASTAISTEWWADYEELTGPNVPITCGFQVPRSSLYNPEAMPTAGLTTQLILSAWSMHSHGTRTTSIGN
ncbi:hypothetical protein WJX73_008755, partial [Symbiochloris irregularis]